MRGESVGEVLDRVSRFTGPVLGLIAVELVRRKTSPNLVRAWACALDFAASELRRMADMMERGKLV